MKTPRLLSPQMLWGDTTRYTYLLPPVKLSHLCVRLNGQSLAKDLYRIAQHGRRFKRYQSSIELLTDAKKGDMITFDIAP